VAPFRTLNRVEFRFGFEPAGTTLRPRFFACVLVTYFADGPDVIEYLSEIPLPGRMLAPPAAPAGSQSPKSTTIGFIAGAENRIVASTVNRFMQPAEGAAAPKLLALFGHSGTGKTHLAHGLVRHWNTNHGPDSAAYLTAGDFYRGLLDAIKRHTTTAFHRALRDHKLLAIDDLHQLPGDDYVSRELRFTLDAYEENGGTIIVTTLRPANTLANISPDLRSRLSSGLSLQLAEPGKSARVRIIRQASHSLGRPLSEEAATRLASGVDGTANDLFGVVFEHCAAADGDHDVASRFIREPQVRDIIAAVSRYFGVPQRILKGQSRRQSIVTARAVAVYLARELGSASYVQIGRALGGRDHTTIIHNHRKIERKRPHDPTLQEAIEELTRIVRNQ
jgi:chromosomal replication initiator protein